MAAGSSCRRVVDVEARHEASKSVAAAPVAVGVVVFLEVAFAEAQV